MEDVIDYMVKENTHGLDVGKMIISVLLFAYYLAIPFLLLMASEGDKPSC
jgi:hypothetical protein